MEFTIDHIDTTLGNLGRLMPARPNRESTRKYSLKETIFLMAPKLLEMKQTGFTSKELVKALANENIAITASTLNRYLLDYQANYLKDTVNQPAPEKPKKTSSSRNNKPAEKPDSKISASEFEGSETEKYEADESGKGALDG